MGLLVNLILVMGMEKILKLGKGLEKEKEMCENRY